MPTNPSHHFRPSPMAVAVDHRHGFKPPIWNRRCRLRSFPHPDAFLLDPDHPSSALPLMPSPNFPRSISTPCLSSSTAAAASPDEPADHIARIEIVGGRRACGVPALVVEAAIAMASGTQPVPVSNGLNGAYYLRNRSGESFAIVKPTDEEPLPIGILGRPGSRHSVRAGETGVREVAAYLLDHGSFSGVPPTALIKISHPAFASGANSPAARKTASIQRFVPHDFDAGDLGPSRFSVSSVHRIGILDIRLLNIDRHAGNILVKKRPASSNGSFDSYDSYSNDSVTELVPIDHGLCLPEILDDPYFEWLHWPQAAVPFSEHEAEYVSALDPFRDAELLRAELPSLRESAIRILVLCTIFLKGALASGLCLADIGDMMTREFSGLEEGGPSMLETLCKQAEDSMNGTTLPSDDEELVPESHESKRFQFEMECDDRGFSKSSEVVEIPLLLQSKARKDPTANADNNRKGLVPSHEGDGDEEGDGGTKLGGIARSVSFSAAGFSYEGVGGSGAKCISFEGLSEEEWGRFLERFEQLLPDGFEARKSMGLKQRRLGTSCKF